MFIVKWPMLKEKHWWFKARRQLIAKVIRSLKLAPQAQLLEAGCGTGGNLAMLSQFGLLHAFEPETEALSIAVQRGAYKILHGSLPLDIPFSWESFDLVVALDVLEHVEDDAAALASLRHYLKPGGRLLITVPAHPWLWSEHDARHHHHRRYTRQELRERLEGAGFAIRRLGYFNTVLFPLIAGVRLLQRVHGKQGAADDAMPSGWVNRILYGLFMIESLWIGRCGAPMGVSLLAVVDVPRVK